VKMVSKAARTKPARTAVPNAPSSAITARCAIHRCASQPVVQPRLGPTRALADAAARPVTWRLFSAPSRAAARLDLSSRQRRG
jgi:hypothetical protein